MLKFFSLTLIGSLLTACSIYSSHGRKYFEARSDQTISLSSVQQTLSKNIEQCIYTTKKYDWTRTLNETELELLSYDEQQELWLIAATQDPSLVSIQYLPHNNYQICNSPFNSLPKHYQFDNFNDTSPM